MSKSFVKKSTSIFSLLVVLLISQLNFGQSREAELQKVLDSVIHRAKDLSLYSGTVNWEDLSTRMHESAAGAATIDALKPAFELMLNELRDHHGNIRKTSDYSILAYFTDNKNSRKTDDRVYNQETWGIVNDIESRFEYALLPGNIGYLKVVGIGGNVDGQTESERIRNAIIELHNKKVDQWVLDLRYNGGGNVNVMLAGLAPLLDTKEVVSIRDANGETAMTAEVIDGDFLYGGYKAFEMSDQPQLNNPKIAILMSRWTVSSGEFVAVAFKGQNNTRFFGEKSGGYTTNNSWDVFNNELALIISTGYYCDRFGNVYEDFVSPDEEIEFRVESDRSKDEGILRAVEWLKLQ